MATVLARPGLTPPLVRRRVPADNDQERDVTGEAATANLNPWTEAKVDTSNPERGPLLIISGEVAETALGFVRRFV
jgi:hypothetical protein